MKMLSIIDPTSKTNFHGFMIPVLPDDEFLAADPDGVVYAYIGEPPQQRVHYWDGARARRVGIVDLDGFDWRQTLVEVDPVIGA